MGRVKSATKNIAFGYLSNMITMLGSFVLRTIFISRLGETLNGVNDLYTGILSILSMAELGVGTAFNYSLYGPVARGDFEKIKSYMKVYRKAYMIIGMIIAVIGVGISPFLQYIISNPGSIALNDLRCYYFIFLFNTVSTYFVSYKYSLVNAEQKNYIQTNVITITKIITISLQILAVLITGNFYVYLFTAAIVELLQKIFVSSYLNKRYPYLKDQDVKALSREESREIVAKTKALVFHKVGDVARLQTDSIIIAAFIDVGLVGKVGNYNMVITSVSNFVNIIFNSVLSSFGNLIATEDKEKQYSMFQVYRFAACWIYGFSAIGFYMLLTPLVGNLWLGENWILAPGIVGCILIDYYFKGDRVVLSNFKTAAGVFEQDKYLALIQGAVNLVISIVLVQRMGLIGVYIGTIVSGLIANITKPCIIYKVCFQKKVAVYFRDSLKYCGVLVLVLVLCLAAKQVMMPAVTFVTFVGMMIVVTVIFNGCFLLLFGRSKEFHYLWGLVKNRITR